MRRDLEKIWKNAHYRNKELELELSKQEYNFIQYRIIEKCPLSKNI